MENSQKLPKNITIFIKTELKIIKPETTIEALHLSTRSYNALRRLGYNYVIDLVKYLKYKHINIIENSDDYELAFETFQTLLEKRNRRIGKKSAFEIAYRLIEYRRSLINKYTKTESR